MERKILVCIAGLLLLSISVVVQAQDPCQKFHDKYQVCLENRDASLNVDYNACQAITDEGACGLAECYWWAAKGKCVPALCYGDTNFDGKVTAWDYGIYKYEDGRNPCPQTPTNPGYLGAPVPKTGRTQSLRTGDDGDLERGVPWPNPRFTDNLDGTVTDNLTGLIWLKNANCFGVRNWSSALSDCNTLHDPGYPGCELDDDSSAGDWRLPNRFELESLLDLDYSSPALPNTAGNGKWAEGNPFTNVQPYWYWSSTTKAGSTYYITYSWAVELSVGHSNYTSDGVSNYVWPVRAGQ